MTPYWQGFVDGALAAVAAILAASVVTGFLVARALRPRDGVEP